MKQPSVTIVGAGIIGIACALELQKLGRQVTLIDREEPGEGCSKGNAGIFAFEAIEPLISPAMVKKLPGMLLDPLSPLAIDWRYLPFMLPWMLRFLLNAMPQRVAANRESLATLLLHAGEAHQTLLRENSATSLIKESGWMTVYESEECFLAGASDRLHQQNYGIRVETFEKDELHEQLPDLGSQIGFGTYYPDSAFTVEPYQLAKHLAEQFLNRGGKFKRRQVVAVESENSKPLLVTTTGSQPCEQVLVTAGAWSGNLARSAGDSIPLDTERGYHLMIRNAGINPSMPVMSGEHHFVTTPLDTGLRLAGTSELAGLKREPNYERADILLNHARRLWPGLEGESGDHWMGLRPTLPDSLPVLGPSAKVSGLYYAFGHQHLGLTLAAISARLMGAMITNQPAEIDMTPYRADRF